MKYLTTTSYLGLLLVFSGCSLLFGSKEQYKLDAATQPSQGGTVNPASGTYDEGSSLDITAQPNNGWEFTGWTGDITSSENPLPVTFNKDIHITANFRDLASNYKVMFTIADAADSIALQLGQQPKATDGFDHGTDIESPPPPPSGALHGYFNHNEFSLLRDYRSASATKAVWYLNAQAGSGNQLTISWTVDANKFEGDLTMQSGDNSQSINMKEDNSLTINSSEINKLEISYQLTP